MDSNREAARAAKDHLRARLHGLPGVGGIGLGRRRDSYVITVTVAQEEAGAHVPGRYEGVDVEVRVSGPVLAQPAVATATAEDAPSADDVGASAEDGGPVGGAGSAGADAGLSGLPRR